ncbi:MAG: PQQ-binding-like beta-propeller repeat protein [Pseudomonadota bacterium]
MTRNMTRGGSMRIFSRTGLMTAMIAVGLSGCGVFDEDEVILPGERIPVRSQPAERASAAPAAAISAPRANAEWTQVNGSAAHALGHIEAPASLSVAWRADIGVGGDGLTATPVVAEGKVFTLDGAARLSAFSTSGGSSWRTDLTPEGESSDDGFGGGLAYDSGALYVTTGFGEVIAVDPSSGEIRWRQKMSAPIRSAPAASNGVVVAVARDNTAIAYAGEDGAVLWRLSGAASASAGILGGASPAISPGGVAIVPFASGELIAARLTTGQRLWTDVISGGRRAFARSVISDISADPVIQGVVVIAGNQSGQLVAIDGRNGRRGWVREFGARNAVWVDGTSVYLISDNAELRRLASNDGGTVWTTTLEEYRDPDDREDAIAYGGPVLAGGRLLVTSSEGEVLSFDPATGAQTGSVAVSGINGLGPVVAGGTVYVMTSAGGIVALR